MTLRVVILAVALLLTPAAGARTSQRTQTFPRISPLCQRDDFRSGGQAVRAALCRHEGTATVPAVVVLHGCGGMGGIDGVLARDLPAHGVAAFYVDYFSRTPPPGKRGFCGAGGRIASAFPVWQQTVMAAVDVLRHTRGIEAGRIGAVGWSLGGGLALTVAQYGGGTTPLRHSLFRALVVLSAFDESSNVTALPPTLVLSGGRGDAVPVSDARALYRALRKAHIPAELRVYAHGNHSWKHRQRIAGERWTFAFLRRYLRGR
jgi:dienelactone hydrolase